MKTWILTIILTILTICSLPAQTVSVDRFDGFTWRSWTTEERMGYCRGFTGALAALGQSMKFAGRDADAINGMTYFPYTMTQLCEWLDSYYEEYQNRDDPLFLTILYMMDLLDEWFPLKGIDSGSRYQEDERVFN